MLVLGNKLDIHWGHGFFDTRIYPDEIIYSTFSAFRSIFVASICGRLVQVVIRQEVDMQKNRKSIFRVPCVQKITPPLLWRI